MMKQLSFLFLFSLVSSLNWIEFVDENGEAVTSSTGMELAAGFGTNAGGGGGGAKPLTCDFKKGIKQICMVEGRKYIGKITMTCKDESTDTCGIAKGDGSGSNSCYTVGSNNIYGVSAVTDGRYIKSVTLYGQNKKALHVFAAGSGTKVGDPGIFAFGGPDTSKGPLLALKLRCGWWIDAVSAGFGVLSANCVLGGESCGACNPATGEKKCQKPILSKQTGDGTCKPTTTQKKCPVDCKQTVGAWGACNKACGGGTQTRTVKETVKALNGGKACAKVSTSQACNTQSCEDNVKNGGSKYDGGSCTRGQDLRKWFNGPNARGTPLQISGSVWYRDQGWGNKKTDVFFCCDCGAHVQATTNCVSLCGTNVRSAYKHCKFNKNVASTCKKGSSTCVAYRVGGGCGHRFYGKNFDAKLKYKSTLLEDDDVIFAGEFMSDIIAFDEEEDFSYLKYGFVAGAIVFMGIGTFVYKKQQQQNSEYEHILDV